MKNLTYVVLLFTIFSTATISAEELDDDICMPKVLNNAKINNYMEQIKGLSSLSKGATSNEYVEQMNKIYGATRPSFIHCKKGQWIPSLSTSYALEYCDFSKTPTSAATLGACIYRGEQRKIVRK